MKKREYKCTAATKDALLASIIQLVKEKGYEKITIRDICKKADISIGAFYHHYDSKEELAKEAYYHIDKLIIEDFREIYINKSSKENLYAFLEICIKYVSEDVGMIIKEYYKLMINETDISAFNPELLYYKTLKQILIDCSKDGYISKIEDSTELAEYCIRFIRGLIFDWSLNDGKYDLLKQFEIDFERFMSGLK